MVTTSGEGGSRLEAAIAALEAQRAALGDAVVESAIGALRRELADLRRPVGAPSPPSLEGERKLVTVMFADLSGFTALSERLHAERARSLMNDCFEVLVPVIERYDGTVDKFVGDAIVALFGAPVAHENDAERALRAALEMMEALAAFNAERATDLGLHFGINTGSVVAGGVGSRGRQEYSVIGQPVNLAARLEDASQRGEIFVGPDTHRLTSPLFDFEALPGVRVQGVPEPVAVYRLRGVKSAPGSIRGIQGLSSPLVGREAELRRLQEALGSLREGRGGVIAVVGEAGLGKSRLIAEARRDLAPGMGWFEGRALSYTQGMSYWMARDVLHALLGVERGAPPDALAVALGAEVARLFPDGFGEIYTYLARLLELPLEEGLEERVRYLSAEALQRRIAQTISAYFGARAQEEPLTLVWEDLHWADPSSLALLESVAPLAGPAPLLLVLVFRPNEEALEEFQRRVVGAEGDRYRRIELEALDRGASTRLLENLLDPENLSPQARALILEKAEGNAFFLEEVLRSLIDSGLVVLRGNRAVAVRPIGQVDVPDTLQGVVMARIDRLPPTHKRALQSAAVIGRVFQERLLSRLVRNGWAGDGLDASLAELLRREFIRTRGAPDVERETDGRDREYIFKHAVTQEVAYESLFLARRRELHARVGEAIEALWPAQLDERSGTLGYHFQRAGVAEKALRYLSQAAEQARVAYANAEAIAYHRVAIEQAEALLRAGNGGQAKGRVEDSSSQAWREQGARLQESLADLLELTGRHDEARAAHQAALALVTDEDSLWRSRLHRKTAKTWEGQREFERALEAYAEAERTVGSGPRAGGAVVEPPDGALRQPVRGPGESERAWWEEWVEIGLERMWVYYFRAQVREMTEQVEAVRPALERYGTAAQRSLFFLRLVLIAFRRDRYVVSEETLDHARAALAEAQETGDLVQLGMPRFVIGMSHMCRVELDEAEEHLLDALAIAERTGDVVLQSRCLTYLMVVHRRGGRLEETRRFIERTLEVATTAQMIEYVAMAEANLAWLAHRAGDRAAVEAHGRQALELWKKSWIAYPFQWAALWPLVAVEVAQERIPEAVEHSRAMLEAPQQPLPAPLADALAEALSAWDAGRLEAACTHLQRSVGLAEELAYL